MPLVIEQAEKSTVKTVKWKNAALMSLYRTVADDLLVLAASEGHAVALRTNGVAATRVGAVWRPGVDSLWVEVKGTLSLHGDE